MSSLVPQGALRSIAREHLKADGSATAATLARTVLGAKRVEVRLAERLIGTLLGDDPAFERVDGRWRLAHCVESLLNRSLAEIPFVVVDVETTGGRPPGDRVIEIGAVRVRGGEAEGEWSTLVNPDRSIPWYVSRLTGIVDAEVDGAPRFGDVARTFTDFLGDDPFVAHNASFDWRFVNAELLRACGARLTNARLCTVRMARRLMPHVRRRNLDALAHLFGVTVHGRHRALGDARATASILNRLLQIADEKELRTEADLASFLGIGGTLYPEAPY